MMLDLVCRVLVAFLAIVGLTEVCRFLILWLLQPRKAGRMVVLLAVQGHDEEMEYRLKSVAEKMKWMNGTENKEIVCVDCGMDEETKTICEKICERNSFIYFCSNRELPQILEHEFANT